MKTYCCMWCKPFIIIIAFCLFRQGVCLRGRCRLFLCEHQGLSQAQGFTGEEGPTGCRVTPWG